MPYTLLGTVEYQKISKNWQVAYNSTSLANYTGNKADYGKWYKTEDYNTKGEF